MNDEELVNAFETVTVDPAMFRHREHLRVAWCYLRTMPLEEALARYVKTLRALTAALGVPEKFHRTATWAWMLLLDEAMASSPDADLDALLERHPHLGSSAALLGMYPRELLDSDRARLRFVLPEHR